MVSSCGGSICGTCECSRGSRGDCHQRLLGEATDGLSNGRVGVAHVPKLTKGESLPAETSAPLNGLALSWLWQRRAFL